VSQPYSFNNIPPLIFFDTHVKLVKHLGLVSLVTGTIALSHKHTASWLLIVNCWKLLYKEFRKKLMSGVSVHCQNKMSSEVGGHSEVINFMSTGWNFGYVFNSEISCHCTSAVSPRVSTTGCRHLLVAQ